MPCALPDLRRRLPTAALALALAAALLLGLCLAPAGRAQQPLSPALQAMLKPEDPVVALVGGREIRWNEVVRSAAALPEEQQAQIRFLFPILLNRLVDRQLLADAARARGYDRQEAVRQAVRRYEEDLIRDAYVADYLSKEVTAQAVEQRLRVLSDGQGKDAALRRQLREEMSRLAMDRLLTQLRQAATIRLYPQR